MTARIFALAVAATLFAAGCSDSDSGSEPAPATTQAAAATTAAPATTQAPAPATTEASGEPAQATHADVAITRVDFESGEVTVTNFGANTVSLEGLWLCQFPTYVELSGVLNGGATMAFGGIGTLDASSGEAGLYIGNNFGDSETIVSYVEWGESDHERSSEAARGGVWAEGDFVDSAGATSLVATADQPFSAADWTVG